MGLFQLANLGDRIGIDLWNHEIHGAGLRKALDYILPYALNEQPLPHKQIQPINEHDISKLLCQAIIHYHGNPLYVEAYESVDRASLSIDPALPSVTGKKCKLISSKIVIWRSN